MNVGEVKVLGITKNVSDKGTSYNIYGYTPFEDWENTREGSISVGYKTVNEWTRVDLSLVKPNDVIKLRYGKGFQGKAVLVGYDQVSIAK